MTDKEILEKALKQVNARLNILDLIEERLLLMKELTQRVAREDLTDKEIAVINQEVNDLKEQVNLLDKEATSLS